MSARSPYGLAGVSSLSRLVQTPFLAARLLLLGEWHWLPGIFAKFVSLALVAIFAFLSLIFAILHLYLTRQVTKGKGELRSVTFLVFMADSE